MDLPKSTAPGRACLVACEGDFLQDVVVAGVDHEPLRRVLRLAFQRNQVAVSFGFGFSMDLLKDHDMGLAVHLMSNV